MGFTLLGFEEGPTIHPNDQRHLQIRLQALGNEWFPRNARLYAFVAAKHFDIYTNDESSYMIHDSHIDEVIEIIRQGIRADDCDATP